LLSVPEWAVQGTKNETSQYVSTFRNIPLLLAQAKGIQNERQNLSTKRTPSVALPISTFRNISLLLARAQGIQNENI